MSQQPALANLLQDLSLGTDGNATFSKELNRCGFTIFTPISDNGYFAWNPPRGFSYKSLANVVAKDVITHVNLDEKPPKLVSVKSLQLPQTFRALPPQEHENKFPYGQIDIACLHVASQHRGVDLNQDVEFAFGGSTLEMLAKQDDSSSYMATLVPCTNTILVVKCKSYTQNYADIGFQFERFVTGMRMSDRPDVEFVEHLHVLKVGSYRVLFRAETDALHNGCPVEIKASNPSYWGTKVMFQMISSGSPKLCHGVKGRGVLRDVRLLDLSKVAQDALLYADRSSLEDNILAGMKALQTQMADAKEGEVYRVSFSSDGSLKLNHARETRNAALLPSVDTVKELVSVHCSDSLGG